MTAPFWVHRVPYTTRILICGLFGLLSFLMAAAFEPLSLRLLGVAFASVCSGWGEVTFLALTSHYGRGAVGAWSSGTGFAGIAGAGWYLFLRSVLGASARLTLALGAVFPLFYVSTYLFLLTKPPSVGRAHDPALAPRRKGPVRESTLLSADAIAGREGRVTPPPSPGNSDSDDEVSSSHTPPPVWTSSGVGDDTPTDEVGDKHSRFAAMTTRERLLRIQPLILPYMLPLFLVYFAVRCYAQAHALPHMTPPPPLPPSPRQRRSVRPLRYAGLASRALSSLTQPCRARRHDQPGHVWRPGVPRHGPEGVLPPRLLSVPGETHRG